MRFALILAAAVLLAAPAGAQDFEVNNVRFEVDGTRVIVSYDLNGAGEYQVVMRVSPDAGQTWLSVESVLGDVGIGILPGSARTIIWNVLDDFPQGFDHEGVVFDVTATLIPQKKSRSMVYLLIGALVAGAGGTAALVLGGGGGGTGPGNPGNGTAADLPNPPGRPGGS
jgi:hypothetical protein